MSAYFICWTKVGMIESGTFDVFDVQMRNRGAVEFDAGMIERSVTACCALPTLHVAATPTLGVPVKPFACRRAAVVRPSAWSDWRGGVGWYSV